MPEKTRSRTAGCSVSGTEATWRLGGRVSTCTARLSGGSEPSWAAASDPSRRIGRIVEFHTEMGSTNDRAREALAAGVGDGLVVVADLQTAGRGRRGRTWTSPAGVNLMLSVGLRPRLDAADAGL